MEYEYIVHSTSTEYIDIASTVYTLCMDSAYSGEQVRAAAWSMEYCVYVQYGVFRLSRLFRDVCVPPTQQTCYFQKPYFRPATRLPLKYVCSAQYGLQRNDICVPIVPNIHTYGTPTFQRNGLVNQPAFALDGAHGNRDALPARWQIFATDGCPGALSNRRSTLPRPSR